MISFSFKPLKNFNITHLVPDFHKVLLLAGATGSKTFLQQNLPYPNAYLSWIPSEGFLADFSGLAKAWSILSFLLGEITPSPLGDRVLVSEEAIFPLNGHLVS